MSVNKKTIASTAGGVTGLALLAGLMIGVPAVIDANRAPTPAPTSDAKPAAVYVISDYEHPTPTPEPVVVQPPAPEPVVEEPVYVEPEYTPGQSGDPVPFIPSDDPQNANGGDYIDPGVYCLSGSASGSTPICD